MDNYIMDQDLNTKAVRSYEIKGNFYEACDCEVICSCWAGLDPDMGQCTGIWVWEIKSGTVVYGEGSSDNSKDAGLPHSDIIVV